MTQRGTKLFILVEFLIILIIFISYNFFLSSQIAYLSGFFIILGSTFSYKKMIEKKIRTQQIINDKNELDKIDDPFDLFGKEDMVDIKNINLKQTIKNEKKRIKVHNYKNLKLTSSAVISIFRILPYIFLILGFIILSKNHHLLILPFLLFLTIGIYLGFLVGQKLFIYK